MSLFSKPGVEVYSIFLYQPEDVVASRISGAKALADYCHRLEDLFRSCYEGAAAGRHVDVVVVIAPGEKSACWLVPAPDANDEEGACFASGFGRVIAPPASGAIAFAMRTRVSGGGSAVPKSSPPFPEAWKELAARLGRPLRLPDDLVASLWPGLETSPASNAARPRAPDGFVEQALDPTRGRVFRPKSWFYAERHRGPTFDWIIAREDPDLGPYETGVRIQMFSGVSKASGKSPRQFVADILHQKRQSGRVLREHPKVDLGAFSRIGLLVEAGNFKIFYSLFWGDKADMAIVSISGTSIQLWGTYSATFDQMRDFELLASNPNSAT